jgi:hypothetical protein
MTHFLKNKSNTKGSLGRDKSKYRVRNLAGGKKPPLIKLRLGGDYRGG